MSSNNEPNAFETAYNAVEKFVAPLGIAATIINTPLSPVPQSQNPATQSEYSAVQESEANKAYEALKELSQSNLELEEQLEWVAETTAEEKIEQREEDLETSLMGDQPIAAGGPDPETETGEGETVDWVGLALNSISSSIETENEVSQESGEIESETDEGETVDWVGLALNSINSSIETENEVSQESGEIESESSESESESESEAESGESEMGG